MQLNRDDKVRHPQYGIGTVQLDNNETVIVRFEHGIEECEKQILSKLLSPIQSLKMAVTSQPSEVILKLMSCAIRSVNDTWGVFSPSRIELLPHQLWVCKKVIEDWPARWLIADDVGLGKTIEAGIILWSLLSKSIVKRLLILCPASLVDQWQYRLRTMFDIRLSVYIPEADNNKRDFWNTHPMVVASIHTIKEDNQQRHERLFESEQWDLLIVDEAHHLNYDEQSGKTLGYSLVERLIEADKVNSILFFTGTPHRGKNFSFFALLKLLRPDLFDPKLPEKMDYTKLRYVMIRNNKECVTDIRGNKIFHKTNVTQVQYRYSIEEKSFYNTLTEFISSGKAYASTLATAEQKTVILILIAMQKLASSSIEAIKRSLIGRLNRLKQQSTKIVNVKNKMTLQNGINDTDVDNPDLIDEIINKELQLMKDEIQRLEELIDQANLVKMESKIETILKQIEPFSNNSSILFFTEYKATQSLLLSALIQKYGFNSVTFINGDGKVDNVEISKGVYKKLRSDREQSAEKFNTGKVRFLVSTESAGEGIDLQENCHHLIHVDIPWNPMRMHQRVGRLNRYGQKNNVEVLILKNPDNVETHIWEILNDRIENIMKALGCVMDDPEDLMQLILGMTPDGFYNEIFFEGADMTKDTLKSWFDSKTSRFAGEDPVDVVKNLIGNVQQFDFNQVSNQIPDVDLPDLKPFVNFAIRFNKRQVISDGETLSFKTPEEWTKKSGVLSQYSGVYFKRLRSYGKDNMIFGVGHKAVDAAISQALQFEGSIAVLPKEILPDDLFVFKIEDKITGNKGQIKRLFVAVENTQQGKIFLKDWQLLKKLNSIVDKPTTLLRLSSESISEYYDYDTIISESKEIVESNLLAIQLPFKIPVIEFWGSLLVKKINGENIWRLPLKQTIQVIWKG